MNRPILAAPVALAAALAVLAAAPAAAAPDAQAARILDALRLQAGRVIVMHAACTQPAYAAPLPSELLVGADHAALDVDVRFHAVSDDVARGTPEGLRAAELPLLEMLSAARYGQYAAGKAQDVAAGKALAGLKDSPVRPQVRKIVDGTRPAYPSAKVEEYFGPTRDLKEGRLRPDHVAEPDEQISCWTRYAAEQSALAEAVTRAHDAFLARAAAIEKARREGYSQDAVGASGAIDAALANLQ